MNNLIGKNIIRFILLVAIQVFVLNNIRMNGYINPHLYVLFILLLPFETPGWLLLTSSFLLGLSVDIFAHTPGLNAAAAVFMAFIRPALINILTGSKSIEPGMKPGIGMGFRWFLFYSFILILIHHTVLFYLEIFRFNEFLETLSRVIISSFATLILVLLVEYLFIKKESKD